MQKRSDRYIRIILLQLLLLIIVPFSQAMFTQPDTVTPDRYDPQLLNRYAFERNNPYKYTDPTGHEPVKKEAGKYKDDKKKDVSKQIDKIIKDLYNNYKKTGKTYTSKDVYKKLGDYYQSGSYKSDGTPRYVYTTNKGWIDMYHYSRNAELSYNIGSKLTKGLGYAIEFGQGLTKGLPFGLDYTDSAWTLEDVPSNFAGAEQGERSNDLSMGDIKSSIDQDFENLGATDPQSDPSYDKLNEQYSKNYEDRANKVPWVFPWKMPDKWR